MLTQMVLVGLEEFSRQDLHSAVYAYFESFLANTYTVFVAIFSWAISTWKTHAHTEHTFSESKTHRLGVQAWRFLHQWNLPDLLGAIDDEVAARVERTLVELTQVTIRQAAQQAVGGAEHDGNFADEGFLVLRLLLLLSLLYDGLGDVDVQRSRVPKHTRC